MHNERAFFMDSYSFTPMPWKAAEVCDTPSFMSNITFWGSPWGQVLNLDLSTHLPASYPSTGPSHLSTSATVIPSVSRSSRPGFCQSQRRRRARFSPARNHEPPHMRTKPILAQRQVDFRQKSRHAQGELVILGLYGLAKQPEPQREPPPPPGPPPWRRAHLEGLVQPADTNLSSRPMPG